MSKIIDYIVVNNSDYKTFIRFVKERIDKGYVVSGGITIDKGWYYQPMIKEDINHPVDEQEIELLRSLAKEADKEYNRSDIDNWTFSLGALTHEKLMRLEQKFNNSEPQE